MQLSMRTALVLGWLVLTSFPMMAQDESFQTLTQQGQRYEKEGNYHKAIEAYRRAQASSPAADRKALDRTIARLDEQIQQQLLVNGAKADEIQSRLGAIVSPQKRKQSQADFVALQQRDDATPTDYQALLRRIEAIIEVEASLATDAPADHPLPPPANRPQSPRRTTTATKPTGPPAKEITISMPGNPPDNSRPKLPVKSTKSPPALPNGPRQPN